MVGYWERQHRETPTETQSGTLPPVFGLIHQHHFTDSAVLPWDRAS